MKIVHLFWSLTYGGIETMLVNIANAQAKAGHNVSVFIINDLTEQPIVDTLSPQVKLTVLGRQVGSRNPWWLFKLNWKLWRLQPDIVHLHGSELICTILSRKTSRGACVSTLHALPSGTVRRVGLPAKLIPQLSLLNDGNTTFIDRVPRVCAISQAVHDELRSKYGVDSVVVCNGICTSQFKQRANHSFKLPLRVVQVSRLMHDKKGQDLLIEAVANSNVNIDLTFIGEGESLEFLQKLVAQYHLEERVHFLGKQTQQWIAAHLADYDLFVQPSRYEGFGLTVAEAMAANVPVLVSSGQGPAEVCKGDELGWVFTNGDSHHLCEKLEFVAGHYSEAEAKATQALKYVQKEFDVSHTAERYVEEYRNTIGRGTQF